MATNIGNHSQIQSKTSQRKNTRRRQSTQKPNGTIGPRVQKVGADKFALVCVDPAKQRSDWMMADYFGNLLIEPRKLEHQAAQFELQRGLVAAAIATATI